MHPQRFDAIVQTISRVASRRTALAALLGGLVGPLLPGDVGAARGKGHSTAHDREKQRRQSTLKAATTCREVGQSCNDKKSDPCCDGSFCRDRVCISCGADVVQLALAAPNVGCSGVATFTATAIGPAAPYSFRWSVDGVIADQTSNTLTLQPQLNGACRTVRVEVVGCPSEPVTAAQTFSQCVVTTAC